MKKLAVLILLYLSTAALAQNVGLQVQALLPNAAVVKINGQQKTLRVGDSHAGVTLLAADSRQGTFEINGEQHILKVSQLITGKYKEPEKRVVTIPRDALLQYRTVASINGRRVAVMVDTGANIVAMSTAHASSVGLKYEEGIPTQVETAGGVASAWFVKLDSVDVGGIRVENVEASVIDGSYPTTILLGMSYLKHVKIEDNAGVLSLTRSW